MFKGPIYTLYNLSIFCGIDDMYAGCFLDKIFTRAEDG